MHIVGFDPGNSESTLVWSEQGTPQKHTIPSYIGSGSLAELQRIRSGAGAALLGPDEYVLEHAGKSYFVGRLALEESRNASSARNDVTRYWSGHTLRLLLVLAAEAGLTHIRVMTGLPISVWTAENRKAVQVALQGVHTYRINTHGGRLTTRTLSVDAVAVMMEAAAALATTTVEPVPHAVIDVGGRTTDLFWSEGVRPVQQRCSGIEAGVEQAGDLLRQQVRDTFGRELHYREIRDVLRAHATGADAPRLFHAGQPLMLNGQVQAAIDAVAEQIVQRVAQTWGDERGQIATEAARVLLIGGGAYYFYDALQRAIPQLDVLKQPEHANALGYFAVAAKASEEAWSRNRV